MDAWGRLHRHGSEQYYKDGGTNILSEGGHL
jgi:hypothetical protein